MMRTSHWTFGSEIEVGRAPSPPRRASDHPVGRLANRREILRAREWRHDKHLRFGATVASAPGGFLEGRCLRRQITSPGSRPGAGRPPDGVDVDYPLGRGRATLVSLRHDQARTRNCLVRRRRVCPPTWHAALVSAPGAAVFESGGLPRRPLPHRPRPFLSTELRTVKVEVQLFTPRLRPSRRAQAVHGS